MKKQIFYAVIVLVLLIGASLLLNRRNTSVKNISWSVDGNTCNVAFDIRNHTSQNLLARVTINAYNRVTNVSPGVMAGMSDIVGTKDLKIELLPRSSKVVQEKIKIVLPDVQKVEVISN